VNSRSLSAAAAIMLVVSAAAGGQTSHPAQHKKPFEDFSASAQRLRDSVKARLSGAGSLLATPLLQARNQEHEAQLRDSIVALARAQIGTRYRLGGESPGRAFDCSGLVKFVLSMLQLDLPRTARSQSLVGRPIERDTARLRPGDLLTFGRGQRVTHIGIYVGEGRIVHASVGKHEVVEADMTQGSWFVRHWLGARRLLASADTAVGFPQP
jgi:cell wall-associated NlpC family hydrolase